MASFIDALPFVLGHEGTELFIDNHTGERSRYGITMQLLHSIQYGVTDPNLLTIADVQTIYNKVFWQPNNLGATNDQLVANKIFDMMVNMGASQAVRLLQASLNAIGGACVIDGNLGPHTMITLNQAPDLQLLEELRIKCIGFYKEIATGDRAKYLAGWLTRANDTGGGTVDKAAFSTLRDGSSDRVVKG